MENIVRTSKEITVSNDNRVKLAIAGGYDNFINIEGVDYELKYLNDRPGNKGGNSNIFRLLVSGDDNESEEKTEFIIKISKIALEKNYSNYNYNRLQRFKREIIALLKAEKYELENVVKLIKKGIIQIQNKRFYFYTMEKGHCDLTDHLALPRTTQQKILLFQSVLEGIKQLHEIDIYHRDIKHDNIFMFGEECKVGDLGLVDFKDDDNLALDDNQRIGAFGWETPEAMNKFLSENKGNPEFTYNCVIDESSDIFQLGKLFWYILQGNLPIGCLNIEDFRVGDEDIYEVLIKLLQQGKSRVGEINRRPLNISTVQELVEPLARKYGIA